MNIDLIREYCLAKNNVEESQPFGPDNIVYKVAGKIFLILSLDNEPLSFNLKCDPDLAVELRATYSSVLPGYHMNKKHWNTIVLDGSIQKKVILSWIDHSYELVAPKSPRKKT